MTEQNKQMVHRIVRTVLVIGVLALGILLTSRMALKDNGLLVLAGLVMLIGILLLIDPASRWIRREYVAATMIVSGLLAMVGATGLISLSERTVEPAMATGIELSEAISENPISHSVVKDWTSGLEVVVPHDTSEDELLEVSAELASKQRITDQTQYVMYRCLDHLDRDEIVAIVRPNVDADKGFLVDSMPLAESSLEQPLQE